MTNQGRRAVPGAWQTLATVGSFAGWTDGELLERFAEGPDEVGERAFAVLLDRHGAAVLRVCRGVLGDPHDAEDAFQATFLVLARRARSIRKRDAVGPWLLGVAYRVAGCTRAALARRKAHERRAALRSPTLVAHEEPGDWVPLLREEVGHLPEKFRTPLVLCYLDGLTQEEVARRLGWPIGTVRSRLARGRDRLRRRMVLRGVAPSVAAMAVGSWREAAAPALPRALAERTVRVVAGAALGPATTIATVAMPVATRTQEVLGIMFANKLKMQAAAWLTAGLLVAGAGTIAGRAGALQDRGPGGGADEKAPLSKAERPAPRPEEPPLFFVTIDRDKAADLGLTQEDVRRCLTAPFPSTDQTGHPSVRLDPVNQNQYLVRMQTPDGRIVSVQTLLDLNLPSPRTGGMIPLRNLATITRTTIKQLKEDVAHRLAEAEVAQLNESMVEEKFREAQAALAAAQDRLEALSRGSEPPAAKEARPPGPDQERRLKAVEEKLDRLLSEREHTSARRDEEMRRREAVWDRLTRDGVIGRLYARYMAADELYSDLYRRYLGRPPLPEEIGPLMTFYGPERAKEMRSPEWQVRVLLNCPAFWSSPLASAILRQSDPPAELSR